MDKAAGAQSPTQPTKADPKRRSDLAMIHLAKKELGLDDDMYRGILRDRFGVDSAGDLDQPNRNLLLAFFRGQGWGRSGGGHPGKPHNFNDAQRGPYFRKIEAFLAEAKRPWAYVDGMVKKMFNVARLAFCTVEQLRKVISALQRDAERHGRRTA